MDRRDLIAVAQGKRPADVLVRGGRLVNVFTREIHAADVAIAGQRVALIGDAAHTLGSDTLVIDAAGRFVTPGLIDQHLHVHETQLNIVTLANAILPRGTTGICTDFYGEMGVGGARAVRACLDAARGLPLTVWFALGTPGYFQNGPFGHTGWPTRDEVLEMLDWPECIGMDDAFASRIAAADERILELIDAVQTRGKRVCGHGSEMRGRGLSAWMAYVRVTDDHECVEAEEAVEKARLGFYISMREGSGCFNVAAVSKAVSEHGADPRRFCFSTDLISPIQIADDGHIDNAIRQAVRQGVPPIVAVQMATLNAAECLGVQLDHGSVSPGKIANLLLVEDLAAFSVDTVVARGRVVARQGQMVQPLPNPRFPAWAYGTVRLPRPVRAADFAIAIAGHRSRVDVRVIVASGRSLLTEEARETVAVDCGEVRADPTRDILKIAAIERVRGTGEIGVGLIRGFGLRSGAIATTYNSQQQNLIVLGADDGDMAVAANALASAGGGFVVADGGKVRALLPLPLFGLESHQDGAAVLGQLRTLDEQLAHRGCCLPAAFHTLGFMGLPVDIGRLKICPRGLVDVWKETVVDLVL